MPSQIIIATIVCNLNFFKIWSKKPLSSPPKTPPLIMIIIVGKFIISNWHYANSQHRNILNHVTRLPNRGGGTPWFNSSESRRELWKSRGVTWDFQSSHVALKQAGTIQDLTLSFFLPFLSLFSLSFLPLILYLSPYLTQ